MLNSIAKFLEVNKDSLIAVTWFLAAFSLFFTNCQANRREIRKETRAEVDAINKSIGELVAKCRKYYLTGPDDNDDQLRVSEITFEIRRIISRAERLRNKYASFKDSEDVCQNFLDKCTSGTFQSRDRQALAATSPEIADIEESAHALMDKLEDGYMLTFSAKNRLQAIFTKLTAWFEKFCPK